VLFLSPDAPLDTGTKFWRSKSTMTRNAPSEKRAQIFEGGYYDMTKFEVVDTVGNVFNRLVLFDAQQIHSATQYFGNSKHSARLFQIFFFDVY